MLLEHYGYNIDGMNDVEFYGNVSPENMERVKELERSIFGIGYPVKAFFGIVIFSPYLFVVYLVGYIFGIIRRKKKCTFAKNKNIK